MVRMANPWVNPKTGIYYIRVAIPAALRPYFKKHHNRGHEWKEPLVDPDTGQQARTERDARRLWADYWSAWVTAKGAAEADLGGAEFTLSDRQTQALCADWLARELAEYDDLPSEADHIKKDADYEEFLTFRKYPDMSRFLERGTNILLAGRRRRGS